MSTDFSALSDFAGKARLFPLPNLVLFPQVMQPLHIFEPRYRAMTTDALAGDRLIAVVLLQPGWEADYAGRPSVHPIGCLGRIVADQRLDDGRFNILLRGLSRIRITGEEKTGDPYRTVRAELLEDIGAPVLAVERKLRRQLARRVPAWFAGQEGALEQLRKLLKSQQPLGVLTDVLAFALPLDAEVKQDLLETIDVERRTRRLLRHMEANEPPAPAPEVQRKFPPEFSEN
jgi:Lon protease-like protein